MMAVFIILQFILFLFMIFHDWISIPPFTDIKALKASTSTFYRLLGSIINGTVVLIPLIITLNHYPQRHIPLSASITIVLFYLLITIGTILSWWVPYFFGSSEKLKKEFSRFKNTHHFLPRRGNNIVPNTLHVVLHLQVWLCLAIAIYFLINSIK